MKKQLIKEILDIDEELKSEIKQKEKSNNELKNLVKEVDKIEEKIKKVKLNNNKIGKIQNISILNKAYSISIKKNKEKTFIENNLFQFRKQNEQKEKELENNYSKLLEKSQKNEQLISKKKEKLDETYEAFRRVSNLDEQEQIIISPENMSIHLKSKTQMEIDFLQSIIKFIKQTKINNEKILREIDSNIKILTSMNSKKESSCNAELSTGVKNSSHLENKNILQKLEVLNNVNVNNNNDNDSVSSISMELETNLNLDDIPSEDESLRFIDKVFDIKSNIKPIKNKLKMIFPPNPNVSKEKTIQVEPIKIGKPIDYKSKEENVEKSIEIVNKAIENKKNKIEEIKNRKKIIEEKLNNNDISLKQVLIKIKIIKEQIETLKKQMEDFSKNKEKSYYYRLYSINNLINNRRFCTNIDNNIIRNIDTIGNEIV
jgi:hypothetical protein